MTFEKLSAFCAAAPFVAFELFLADGRSFRINHPDYISLDWEGEAANIFYEESDRVEVIDLMAIISLQYNERN